MKPYFIPFLAICLLLSSCIATVPSIPTSHIPEKAHEVNVSGAIGIPRFSVNIAYNPHKNFGFVLAGNAGKESFADILLASSLGDNHSKWRTYIEGGVAGYYHFNEWFAMSLTPTVGKGKFFIIDGSSVRTRDTLGGTESRQSLSLNSRIKFNFDEDFGMQFRFGLKAANNTMKINAVDFSGKSLLGQSFNLTTLETMFYMDFQFRNFAMFSVIGGDVLQNSYKNETIDLSRSPFYLGIGIGYTFNGLKPWEGKPKKKP